ncbi:phosphodiester glycosidase family protein [Microcoleus sp. FACHB-672]|nr:phosphodiester glycosidase family protein [Microcoleus sp. FACHB-672]
MKQLPLAAGIGLLLLPLLLYARQHLLRPVRTNLEMTLFQGITYKRQARNTPRPYMLHIVSIDLTASGIGVLVTPGNSQAGDNTLDASKEIQARTTSEFVSEFKLQLAINAGYFFPFREHTPWDFYPRSGERVNVVGQAIANGSTYSGVQSGRPVLCFNSGNRAQIFDSGQCPTETVHAVAGSHIVLKRGVLSLSPESSRQDKPYSRVAVAIDRQGQKLWLIVIDGKQPLYSEGVTLGELSEIAQELGAFEALNLDGGGSATLVVANDSGVKVLNAPIHTKVPMRQRPVANHLGFFADF